MTIRQINENTWCIDDGFVRSFLLAGGQQAVLIDTGASSAEAKQLAESVTDKPVVLVNTHGDGDHVAGNAAFARFFMHPADYANCGLAARCPVSELIPLQDGDIMELGGRTLEMITIPGHTYGSVAILDVQSRVLYSGDSVQDGHIYMFGAHRQPEAFDASLAKLIALQPRYDRIRAAHGTEELPAAFVQTVRDAWGRVQRGEVTAQAVQLHGRTVQAYDADGCGFYCG